MNLQFNGMQIHGIQLIVPSNEVSFDDEVSDYNFTPQQSSKLKSIMGYDKRRVVVGDMTSSDLVLEGFKSLQNNGLLNLDTIDALIVVTQTPDYLIPGTSYIIHGELKLSQHVICLDINQGCAGFIVGLITAFSLLGQRNLNRVALVNVDVVSRLVSNSDRNSRPIIGDAAAITIIDRYVMGGEIYGNLKVDGSRWAALMVPAGGMKIRSSPATCVPKIDESGNLRALDNLVMKGDAVFNFVMQEVPQMIESLLKDSGVDKSKVDQFLFHQPNPFMLKKIAEKLRISLDKMPIDLVRYLGNSSGVSIPAVLCTNFEKNYFDEVRLMCFAGFGVGLTWGSLLMPIEKPSFIRVLEI